MNEDPRNVSVPSSPSAASNRYEDDEGDDEMNEYGRERESSPICISSPLHASSPSYTSSAFMSSPAYMSSPIRMSSPLNPHSPPIIEAVIDNCDDVHLLSDSSGEDISEMFAEEPNNSLSDYYEDDSDSGARDVPNSMHRSGSSLNLVQGDDELCAVEDGAASESNTSSEHSNISLVSHMHSIRSLSSESDVQDQQNLQLSEPGSSHHASSSKSNNSFDVTISDDDNVLLFRNSTVSRDEAFSDLCELYLKNRWTKKSLSDVIEFLNKVLPQPNTLPKSLHLFLKHVTVFSASLQDKTHFYCGDCYHPKLSLNEVCSNNECMSSSVSQVFYEIPIKNLVKFMFEKRGLADAIDSYRTRVKDDCFIRDILDGSELKRIKLIHNNPYDINLLFNTDGFNPSSSSLSHIWPVMCTVCEVAPTLRKSFTFVVCVWVDKKDPVMSTYLKPVVDSLVEICDEGGVSWKHPTTGEIVTSMVTAPLTCADAPARALLQNVQRYNSKYGCNICETKSKRVPVAFNEEGVATKHYRYFVYSEDPFRLRSGDRMYEQGCLAERRGKSIKGVKGLSALRSVPNLDVGKCVFPEYMHALLLGVVSTFTQAWQKSVNKNWRFNATILKTIDDILLSVKPADFITRMPRGLSSCAMWKAQEFRTWLLYYSLPILSDFLPEQYMQHWILLVGATFLLLKDVISEDDLKASEIMLRMFVRDVSKLYTEKEYKYNVHQLLHFKLTVERCGPLWSNSAFLFEDLNGYLKNLIHGTKHKGKELIENIKIMQGILALRAVTREQQSRGPISLDCSVLGAPVQVELTPAQLVVVNSCEVLPYTMYNRVKYGSEIFTTSLYDQKFKRCNSCVVFKSKDGEKLYGEIVLFLKCNRGVFCLIDVFDVDHLKLFFHMSSRFKVSHIVPIKKSQKSLVVEIENIMEKALRVLDYLCFRPNSVEYNL